MKGIEKTLKLAAAAVILVIAVAAAAVVAVCDILLEKLEEET